MYGFNIRMENNPSIKIYEKNGDVIVKMNIPGFDKNNVRVRIQGGRLHISAQQKQQKEIAEENYYAKIAQQGSVDEMISLPSGIDTDAMDWEMNNGTLTVTIPKIEE
jgi:HSP20 family protein